MFTKPILMDKKSNNFIRLDRVKENKIVLVLVQPLKLRVLLQIQLNINLSFIYRLKFV